MTKMYWTDTQTARLKTLGIDAGGLAEGFDSLAKRNRTFQTIEKKTGKSASCRTDKPADVPPANPVFTIGEGS